MRKTWAAKRLRDKANKARAKTIARKNRRSYEEKGREATCRFLSELLVQPRWGDRVFRSNAELAEAIPNAYRPAPRWQDEEKKE